MITLTGKAIKKISTNVTKKKILEPVPLEEVLECMKDNDYVVASAARAYYQKYYN